jgi:ferredoxin
MGLQQRSDANDVSVVGRQRMPVERLERRFDQLDVEVELGFSAAQASREVERCLNCDIQTVFDHRPCIECDACVNVCPPSASRSPSRAPPRRCALA